MASAAIAPLLRGPDRAVTVLAGYPHAAYLAVDDDLVALVTSDGIRHPNAVVLDLPSSRRPLDGLVVGLVGRIGHHGLSIGGLHLRIARWWDPRPRLRTSTPGALRAASDLTRQRVAAVPGPPPDPRDTAWNVPLADATAALLADASVEVLTALQAGDDVMALGAAERIIGLGPGLTPSGDDRLAGLIAGTSVLAPSIRPTAGADIADVVGATERLGHAVAVTALGRTTSVSAALLRHAAMGEMAEPAAALVRAWVAPDRDVARATDRLLAVGSSSGRELALGLLAAVELLTARPGPVDAGPMHPGPAGATPSPSHHPTTERPS